VSTDPETGDRRQATGDRRLQIGADLADRLLDLGVRTLFAANQLPREPAGRHVRLQWIRAATAAGANYEEARAAESREDFIHKVSVAAKELRETGYWARFVRHSGWAMPDLDDLIEDSRALAATLAASARTARERATGGA
jgi:four helix bundle protein